MRSGFWADQNNRAIVRWADRGPVRSTAVVATLLAASWAAAYTAGGSHTVAPHLFYLPVIIAAARFGHRGALVASVAAGLAAGPALPLDVAAQQAQAAPNWLGRLTAFVVVGQVTAALHSRSLTQAREHLQDRGTRNLSPRQLDDTDLPTNVENILAATGIDPSSLVLEVTETALADDPRAAARSLHALRALGIRIALDDFGVGQSSLSVLHQFPIDIVKIDRSFIAALATNPKVGAVIEAIVALTHALGIEAPVAEGIETHDQLHAVTALGCGTAQGYLIARPLPADDAIAHLSRASPNGRCTGPGHDDRCC